MNIKTVIVDNIQSITTICVFLICTYSSVFVKHNQLTYLMLSIVSIQALMILANNSIFSNKIVSKENSLNKQTEHNTTKQHKWSWLKNDKPLYALCNKLKSIKKIDDTIYTCICDKTNQISRRYYRELMKDDQNLYNNLEKHKRLIQFIEDTMKEIIELFREIEFATTNHKYTYQYNIPDKIDRFTDIINERITLLKHKRDLR